MSDKTPKEIFDPGKHKKLTSCRRSYAVEWSLREDFDSRNIINHIDSKLVGNFESLSEGLVSPCDLDH